MTYYQKAPPPSEMTVLHWIPPSLFRQYSMIYSISWCHYAVSFLATKAQHCLQSNAQSSDIKTWSQLDFMLGKWQTHFWQHPRVVFVVVVMYNFILRMLVGKYFFFLFKGRNIIQASNEQMNKVDMTLTPQRSMYVHKCCQVVAD